MAYERNRTITLLEALQCSRSFYTIFTKPRQKLVPRAHSYFDSQSTAKNPGERLLWRMFQGRKQTQTHIAKLFRTIDHYTRRAVNNFAVFAYEY